MTATELQSEVALMRVMTTGELRAKYREVFQQDSPSRHRERLVRRIGWKLQALAEGGLSERARRRAEEIADDGDLRIPMPAAKASPPVAQTAVLSFAPKPKAEPARGAPPLMGSASFGVFSTVCESRPGSSARKGKVKLDGFGVVLELPDGPGSTACGVGA